MSVYRFQGNVRNGQGFALTGVQVYVLTQPAMTNIFPPTPPAAIFTDSTGATPLTNPVLTDGNGNFFFYAAQGVYTLYIYDPNNGIVTEIQPDQQVVSPGGGTVSSVAVTMPAQFTVAGSPVSSSGTIAVSLANENANLVWAGPASGGAAVPTFRAIVAADLPAGLQLLLTAQNPNTVIAGPASGAAAIPTARQLVAADIYGLVPVAYSATPAFNAALFAHPTFTMTLTGNVTTPIVQNPSAGQHITFVLTQDAIGGHSFTWPVTFHGATNVDNTANAVTVEEFVWDGNFWRAIGPGSSNNS